VTAAARILADLATHGARIVVRDGTPRLVKRAGVPLPEALLATARDHKAELVSALHESDTDPAERQAVAVEMGKVPGAYAKAFEAIQASRRAEVPGGRWDQFINEDCSLIGLVNRPSF
jgi:hypothetical protein